MDRRAVLRALGAAGAVGVSAGSGCLGALAGEPGGFGGENEWRYDVGGRLDAVAEGRVLGREDWDDDDADGAVFALDAETGRQQWTYGQSGPYSTYTDLTVTDGIYVGFGDDAIGSGDGDVHALAFDGTERWTREVGSVYERPRVRDGVCYAGSDDAVVRALDTGDGDVLWATDVDGTDPDVLAVDDVVYVAGASFLGLDRADGSVRWRYSVGDEYVRRAVVDDGVAYVNASDRLAALDGGTERWSVELDGWFEAAESGYLFVDHEGGLSAFAADTGERVWSLAVEEPRVAAADGVVYVGGDELVAVAVDDWTERWRAGLDGATAEGVTVGAGGEAERSVYVQAGDSRLLGFDAGGDRRFDATVEGSISSVLVDDRAADDPAEPGVFVGTDDYVYALDPAERTPTG